jgi:hypothetical protein
VSDYVKDPQDVVDYNIDWGTNRLVGGETISASTWTVPTGITQTTPAPSINGGVTTIWLLGGTVGVEYAIVNHITTSAGRQYDKTRTIFIAEQ